KHPTCASLGGGAVQVRRGAMSLLTPVGPPFPTRFERVSSARASACARLKKCYARTSSCKNQDEAKVCFSRLCSQALACRKSRLKRWESNLGLPSSEEI